MPGALSGERVRVRLEERRGDGFVATPRVWLTATERAAPPCPHFGPCGGCRLQHLPAPVYQRFKRQVVDDALRRRGLAVEVSPLVATPPHTRRRLRLAFERRGRHLRLGFRPRRGHEVVEVGVCSIAHPALVALLAPLRALLRELNGPRQGEIGLTACQNGIDLLVQAEAAPDLAGRELLAAFASEHDLARVCWREGGATEPLAVRRAPQVSCGGVPVATPPQAFLQASKEAEAAMRAEVERAIGGASCVADLFAGIGTFGLPLATAGARVLAVERAPDAASALASAARAASFAQRVEVQARDLERRPLTPHELGDVEAVVLDPPRAGARAQAAALAASNVPRIAYVSCHPGSFARDARTLVDAGYRLPRVTPIDAFLWSAEVELVAAFVRPGG